MTDKEFHNGTEAIPSSERGGLVFPTVAATAAAATAGSGVMTGVFQCVPPPSAACWGRPRPPVKRRPTWRFILLP